MILLKSLRFVALSSIAVAGKTSNLRKHGGSASRGLADCADNLSPWKLELTVDDYPWETRWTIKDLSGNKIAFGPSDDMNYEKRESYVDAGCLPEGDYVFTIKDRSGDGMCCSYGEGNFEFKVDDSTLVESDKNSFKKLEFPFTVRNQIVVDDLESNSDLSSETSEELNPATEAPSTSRPIKDPSRQPTQRPSPSPSVTPSTASPSEVSQQLLFTFVFCIQASSEPMHRRYLCSVSFQRTGYKSTNYNETHTQSLKQPHSCAKLFSYRGKILLCYYDVIQV